MTSALDRARRFRRVQHAAMAMAGECRSLDDADLARRLDAVAEDAAARARDDEPTATHSIVPPKG